MSAQTDQVWEVLCCFSSPLLSFFPLFSQQGEQTPEEGMLSLCTLMCQSSHENLRLPPCHRPTRDSLLQLLSPRDGLQETIFIFLDKSWHQLQLLRDTQLLTRPLPQASRNIYHNSKEPGLYSQQQGTLSAELCHSWVLCSLNREVTGNTKRLSLNTLICLLIPKNQEGRKGYSVGGRLEAT